MFYIDLDEEDELSINFNLISPKGWAPYQLRKSDHYDVGKPTIKKNIIAYLENQGCDSRKVGSIFLLTHLRTFGHVFNPVSFYFVDDVSGNPLYAIAEVGNTFNEQKLFLIQRPQGERFKKDSRKEFYVSPFSDLDTIFHFRLNRPDSRLRIGINQSHELGRSLTSEAH